MSESSDIALIGLAVMGQNLILNMADHGYQVSVYNRTTEVTDQFTNGLAKDKSIIGFHDLEALVNSLKKPRRIVILVKAGPAVDAVIKQLLPLIDKEDIIVDMGNSHFPDTQRRYDELKEKGIRFIGSGISGGEEGARKGPSIMPGGDESAWPAVKDIFQDVSAKSSDNEPCCEWVGSGGAGHYVKMVHNGIEYGDMQLICEAYQMMHEGLGLTHDEMHATLEEWNKGDLDSYLIEITRDIMAYRDENKEPLVEKILDKAGQKGTGKWTIQSCLDLGTPVTLIGEAVFARTISALKDERVIASKTLKGPEPTIDGEKAAIIEDIRQALYASKIVSYAQGYMLLREASKENNWDLNFGAVALMWRGGCIIRSRFLGDIKAAFDKNPELENLLLDQFFTDALHNAQDAWRRTISRAVTVGIAVPAFSTALAFFDSYRREDLPHNLLQAQRDYFGAHTYERKDKPRGEFFHTDWTGEGSGVSSRTYNA
jgi:6-phosphogluconate dehydrogenase